MCRVLRQLFVTLTSSLTWLDRLQIDLEDFILFSEIKQILLKIHFIPILLTFMYLSISCQVKLELNSSKWQIIVAYNCMCINAVVWIFNSRKKNLKRPCSFFFQYCKSLTIDFYFSISLILFTEFYQKHQGVWLQYILMSWNWHQNEFKH